VADLAAHGGADLGGVAEMDAVVDVAVRDLLDEIVDGQPGPASAVCGGAGGGEDGQLFVSDLGLEDGADRGGDDASARFVDTGMMLTLGPCAKTP
jgi:hypothetical protein